MDFVRIKETAFTNLSNEHLDQERLERLAKALVAESLGGSLEPATRTRELAGDRAHADSCAGCKASLESLVVSEMKFQQMMSFATAARDVPTGECPPDHFWASVATGLITDKEAAPWILHASECHPCAALLREATEDLALEATPDELARIQALMAPEWRGKMGRAMSAAASGGVPQPGGWLTWLRRQLRS